MPNVLTLLILLFAGVHYFGLFTDLDWTWHIRTGWEILRTHTLSPPDSFTYTIAGRTLPDFEWLYEVLLAVTWDAFGIGGLKLLRVLLVAAPLYLLGRRLVRAGCSWSAVVLSVLAAVVLLAPFWNLRPLFVTTIGLLFVTNWLKDQTEGRDLHWWTLPVVMLLWTNMHPGVLAGMALLAGAILWEWANVLLRWNTPVSRACLLRLTWVGALGLAATFLCPDPIERFRYALSANLRHPIMRMFTEMQPLHEAVRSHLWPLGAIYLLAGIMIVAMLRGGRAVRGWEWGLALGVTFLAHVAVRAVPDFVLVLLALGVPHLRSAGKSIPTRRVSEGELTYDGSPSLTRRVGTTTSVEFMQSRGFALQRGWLLGILGLLVLISVIPPLSRRMPGQDAPHWPVAAADFAVRSDLRGNAFATPLFGTYLGWRLPEQVRCYADTRGFFFPPALLEDSYWIPMCHGDWKTRLTRILDDGKTDYFLLETTGIFGELHRRLAKHVEPIHQDDVAAIYTAAEVQRVIGK